MDREKRKKVLKEVLKTLGILFAFLVPLVVLAFACGVIENATGEKYNVHYR